WGSLNARETSDFDTPAAAATSRIVGLDPEARGSSPTADPMASSSLRSSCGVYRRWLFPVAAENFRSYSCLIIPTTLDSDGSHFVPVQNVGGDLMNSFSDRFKMGKPDDRKNMGYA